MQFLPLEVALTGMWPLLRSLNTYAVEKKKFTGWLSTIYICMYVCMHACMHACIYIYIYIYIYANISDCMIPCT